MPAYTRTPMQVDSRTHDWSRKVADDLNGIVRGYMFAFFFTTTPDASEVMCIHPVATDCAIPADWGGRIETVSANPIQRYHGVEWSCDDPPASSWAMNILRKPLGSASYTSIGTWTLDTAGVLTAVTAGHDVVQLIAGDVLRFVAPAVADGAIQNTVFTVIGVR